MIRLDFFGVAGKEAFRMLTLPEFTEWPPYIRKEEGRNNKGGPDFFAGGISFADNDSYLIREKILEAEKLCREKADYEVVEGYFPVHIENYFIEIGNISKQDLVYWTIHTNEE